jgi:hypothetical protein
MCDLRRIRLSCTKTKVPLTQVYVTLDELDCPLYVLWFSCLKDFKIISLSNILGLIVPDEGYR